MEVSNKRTNNSGTFGMDRWRIKGDKQKGKAEVTATVRQLSARYGVTITTTAPSERERQSAPLWRRYLQELADADTDRQKAASPFPRRIESLEAIVTALRRENATDAILARLLAELKHTLSAPPDSIDYSDVAVLPPHVQDRADAMGLDDAQAVMLAATEPPRPAMPSTNTTTMRSEADAFFAAYYSRKNHQGKYQVRQALAVVTQVAGNVAPHDLTSEHADKIHAAIQDKANWSNSTKANLGQYVREFLHTVATKKNIATYGFLNLKKLLRWRRPKGKKIRYTLAQVQTALQHATGEVRYALFCGLNFGFIGGDMRTVTPDMVIGEHLVRSRQKLNHHDEPVVGMWLMWSETNELMEQHREAKELVKKYNKFAKQHGLPTHKALRKTTAQELTDHLKDELSARLFRGEATKGTHGNNYVTDFTERQVEHLDDALRKIGQHYGVRV